MGEIVVYRAMGLSFGVCSATWLLGSQPWGTAGLWMGSALRNLLDLWSPGHRGAGMASRLGGHPGGCPCAGSFLG